MTASRNGTRADELAADAIMGDDADGRAARVELRRLQLAASLVDATELHKIPKPVALVAGFLDRDSLCWLQGKPGHAKSFVALDLAGHVAAGRDWRGHHVTQGRVLYVVAEGASGVEQRLRAWELGNKVRVQHGTVGFLPVAVQLLDQLDVAALLLVVESFQPALLVIDTQARVTLGGEENSSKDMGRFVEAADRLRRVCGATILVVHHESRHGENLRGSTAMEGAASTIMRVKKDGALVDLSCVKQKEGPEFEPEYGTLVPVGMSVYWSHSTVGLAQAETDSETCIYATMRDLFGTTGASSTVLRVATELPKSSFHRGLNSLIRKGIVRNTLRPPKTHYVLSEEEQQLRGT